MTSHPAAHMISTKILRIEIYYTDGQKIQINLL